MSLQGRIPFVRRRTQDAVGDAHGKELKVNLRLGSFDYQIRFTDEQLFLNRKAVMAICDHPRRELLVSRQASHGQLKQIVGEAVSRIWSYRFDGVETGVEDWPDEYGAAS